MAENGTQTPSLAPTASPLTFCATATTVVPEFEPGMRAAHGALFVFSMVFIPGTLGWWLVRRKHYALRQRELALVSLTALAVFLNVATNSGVNWYGINTLPCDVHAWTSFWSVPLGAGPTVTRLAIFYSRHRYAQFLLLKNARDKLKNKGMSRSSRFLDTSNLTGLKAYARWMFKSSSESQLAPLLKTRDASRRNLIEVSDTHSETSTHSTWLYALRFMSKPLGLPAIVVGFYLVLGVVTSTIQYFPLDESPYGGKGCTSCRQDNTDYLIFSIALAITTVPGIYLMYKLRDVPDPLLIKYELQLTLGVGILIVVGGAITLSAFPNFREFRAFDPLFAVNVVALLFHGLQTLYPIHLTYRFERESKSAGMQQALDSLKLRDWLSVPEGREAVARYLATEFSIENLFFYEQCEMYEKFYDQFDASEVLELADDIFAAFVSDAGVMTVNISSRERNELLQRYKRLSRNSKPPRDLFEKSMVAVYELMDRDSFYRFKSSEYASDRDEIFLGKIELAPHELSPIRNGDT